MISLSESQLLEITTVPDLIALVDNTNVRSADNFTQLCAIHNCFESFMHTLPHSSFSQNPLTLLARLNRWSIVEQMDCAQFSLNDWKKALRRAGKSGHTQFIGLVKKRICQRQNPANLIDVSGIHRFNQLEVEAQFIIVVKLIHNTLTLKFHIRL